MILVARSAVLAVLPLALLAACANNSARDAGRSSSFAIIAEAGNLSTPGVQPYQIGALDLLDISVFQVPDLSIEDVRVDAAGSVELPLIGTMQAAGLTPSEFARLLETQLRQQYLRDPRVTVRVTEAGSQKITVDGAVTEPGVFEMKGTTTLVQAIAMAKGTSAVSNSRTVAVFRVTEGQRTVAVFDLSEIRAGRASDPVLLGDDIVVVDTSLLNVILRNAISVLPAVATFQAY